MYSIIANLLLVIACNLSQTEMYEESTYLFKLIPARYISDEPAYHFYKMLNAFKLMDNDTVEKEYEFFEDAYYFNQPIPRRYIAVVNLMKADLDEYKDNPIKNLNKKMDSSARRLGAGKAGPETRKLQQEILADLDKLIAQKEAAAKAAADKAAAEKEAKRVIKQKMERNPAEDFHLPGGKAAGEIDIKRVKEYAEVWGKLAPAERATAMVEITRNMPPKYREAIEAYFKKLEKK